MLAYTDEYILETFGRIRTDLTLPGSRTVSRQMREVFATAALSIVSGGGDEDMYRFINAHANQGKSLFETFDRLNQKTPVELAAMFPDPEFMEEAILDWKARIDSGHVDRALLHATYTGVTFIDRNNKRDYPLELISRLEHPPLGLWVRGNTNALVGNPARVAIDGSNITSMAGLDEASKLGLTVADKGMTLLAKSGHGITAVATRTVLSSQGTVVIFAAGGPDRAYPGSNAQLYEQVIKQGGAIVSAQAPTVNPSKSRQQYRDQILAACSAAVVIVESGTSGSSTRLAAMAHDLEVPVGAIPGASDELAKLGCNLLISEGIAQPIGTESKDVLALVRRSLPEDHRLPLVVERHSVQIKLPTRLLADGHTQAPPTEIFLPVHDLIDGTEPCVTGPQAKMLQETTGLWQEELPDGEMGIRFNRLQPQFEWKLRPVFSHPVPGGFWGQIQHQLDRIEREAPYTFDQVKEILDDPAYLRVQNDRRFDAPNRDLTKGHENNTFFAGSGGDRTLRGALHEAGWKVTASESPFYYSAKNTFSGEELTYCEGDVSRGNAFFTPDHAAAAQLAVLNNQAATPAVQPAPHQPLEIG